MQCTNHTDMSATFIEGFHNSEEVGKMKYSPLGQTGMSVSLVGFGSSPLGTAYNTPNAASEESGRLALERALRGGINFIDTAPWYGQGKSEERLGKILKDVPRNSYYIATKVGRYEKNVEDMFDFSAERVTRSVDESLARLGLDYVDIIQVHDLEFAPSLDIIVNETLPALEEVRRAGKAKFIGITGYPIKPLREVVERSAVKIDTVLSYCRLDLNDSALLDHMSYFQDKGIGLISASPLSMALLTPIGPPAWHPASPEARQTCRSAAQYCQDNGVDIAKLAMHYSLSLDAVSVVLVGMDRPEFVEMNLAVANGKLNETETAVLQHIRERFFGDGVDRSWEGVEVSKYWRKLKEKRAAKQGPTTNGS